MSRRRYKCSLSKEQIIDLRARGLSFDKIGEIGGVTGTSIRAYLNPDEFNHRASEYYRRLKGKKRAKFLKKERDKAKESQAISMEEKPKNATFGIEWTLKELKYLRDNIKTKTILELAIDLRRTFHSTKHTVLRFGISARPKAKPSPVLELMRFVSGH